MCCSFSRAAAADGLALVASIVCQLFGLKAVLWSSSGTRMTKSVKDLVVGTGISHATKADNAAAGQLRSGWIVSSRLRSLRLVGSFEACWHPVSRALPFIRLEELKAGLVSRVSRSSATGAVGRWGAF